jgi:hypothetical protein
MVVCGVDAGTHGRARSAKERRLKTCGYPLAAKPLPQLNIQNSKLRTPPHPRPFTLDPSNVSERTPPPRPAPRPLAILTTFLTCAVIFF